jgi:N-formylglutamate amidohydrolase
LQIEVKRTLYMDEASLLPNAGYARLEADLARLVAALLRHIRGELATASGRAR